MVSSTNNAYTDTDMQIIYVFRYLYHVARGWHGKLTARQIFGDACSIWRASH